MDIVEEKEAKCRAGSVPSREIPDAELALAIHAEYASDASRLSKADVILIAVPKPVDQAHIADFGTR